MGLVTLTFDRLTLKLVSASKVGNRYSEFGHASPLGSRAIYIHTYIRFNEKISQDTQDQRPLTCDLNTKEIEKYAIRT